MQVVLKVFDIVVASSKDLLIKYLQDGLKLSIYAQSDKWDKDLKNW